MSVRNWSFARLWAVTAAVWLVALAAGNVLDYFDIGGLGTFALAAVPAFLAGAWAGTHPEIGSWQRTRLVAMWCLAFAAFFGATEYVGHWRALAAVIAAPVAILSLRWYELTGGGPPRPELSPPPGPEPVVTPPPPPSRRSLPRGPA
jgi:hypothetical protein